MSNFHHKTPSKKHPKRKQGVVPSPPNTKLKIENESPKNLDHVSARTFALWYKKMMDEERNDLGPYLADDIICHIFGKKIKTRKKVVGYLKYILETTCHDFITIRSKDNLTSIYEYDRSPSQKPNDKNTQRNSVSPEIISSRKRSIRLRSDKSTILNNDRKRPKYSNEETYYNLAEPMSEVNNQGDGVSSRKKKCITVTPPNRQVGQGDCLPSTSSSDSKTEQSNAFANSQMPRKVVECECFVKFIKIDEDHKTERKCKLQISYSEDPLNIGEYVIWAIYYTGDMKCRKNLLPLFDQLELEEGNSD